MRAVHHTSMYYDHRRRGTCWHVVVVQKPTKFHDPTCTEDLPVGLVLDDIGGECVEARNAMPTHAAYI